MARLSCFGFCSHQRYRLLTLSLTRIKIGDLLWKISSRQADPLAKLKILLEEAEQLTAQKKYAAAEQKYQLILTIIKAAIGEDRPEIAGLYLKLGILDHQQQKYSAAQADYGAAVRLNPEYTPAINKLGLIAYEAEEVDRAIQYWQSAIEINNDSNVAEAKLALAVTLYQRGEKEQGLELAKQSLGNKIGFADIAVLRQNLWGDELVEDAQALLTEEPIKVFITDLRTAIPTQSTGTPALQARKIRRCRTLISASPGNV